jgi:protoporphyrinogen oxidase
MHTQGEKGGQVHLRTSPEVVDWQRREVVAGGERVPYRALVATLPLPELLKRMPNLPPEIEAHAARLRCTTLRYVNIGSRAKPPADWHWIYVPETKYPFYRVNVFSSAMPSMAPPDGAAICIEMSDRGPVGEAALRDSIAALQAAGAVTSPEDVVFAERKEIQYAYVVFDDHYYPATRAIFAFLEANDIHPRGRYGAWTYNAMEDCVLAGREVASLIDGASAAAAVAP